MKRIITIISMAVVAVLGLSAIAYACVVDSFTATTSCATEITWTAYLPSGDTVKSWGPQQFTRPSGQNNYSGQHNGDKAYTTTSYVPAGTAAGTAYMPLVVTNGSQSVNWYLSKAFDASTCNPTTPVPGPTVTATVPVPGPTQTVYVPKPGPTVTASVPVPGPTVTVTSTPPPGPTVTVTATPLPGPTVTVTATPPTVVVTKTPKPVVVYRTPKQPSASFQGPCGDPYYRAHLVNKTKHTVTFIFSYTSFKTGHAAKIVTHVKAGKTKNTSYVHVLGSHEIMIKDGKGTILDAGLAAAPGDYKVCRA